MTTKKYVNLFIYIFLITLVFSTYQNCLSINNSPKDQVSDSLRSESGGDGEPFEGKPEPGDYDHRRTISICEGDYFKRIRIDYTNGIELEQFSINSCKPQTLSLNENDLEFYFYRPNFISYAGDIYQKSESIDENLLPEMWCQSVQGALQFSDILIMHDKLSKDLKYNLLLNSKQTNTSWETLPANSRKIENERVTYTSPDFTLEVELYREVFLGQRKYFGQLQTSTHVIDLVCVSGSGTLPVTPYISTRKFTQTVESQNYGALSRDQSWLSQLVRANSTVSLDIINVSNGDVQSRISPVEVPQNFQVIHQAFSFDKSQLTYIGYIDDLSLVFQKNNQNYFPISILTIDLITKKSNFSISTTLYVYQNTHYLYQRAPYNPSSNDLALKVLNIKSDAQLNQLLAFSFEDQSFRELYKGDLIETFSPILIGSTGNWILDYEKVPTETTNHSRAVFVNWESRVVYTKIIALNTSSVGKSDSNLNLFGLATRSNTDGIFNASFFDAQKGKLSETSFFSSGSTLMGIPMVCDQREYICEIVYDRHSDANISKTLSYDLTTEQSIFYNVPNFVVSLNFDENSQLWFISKKVITENSAFLFHQKGRGKAILEHLYSTAPMTLLKNNEQLILKVSNGNYLDLKSYAYLLNNKFQSQSTTISYPPSISSPISRDFRRLSQGPKGTLFVISDLNQDSYLLKAVSLKETFTSINIGQFEKLESETVQVIDTTEEQILSTDNENTLIFRRYKPNNNYTSPDFFFDAKRRLNELFFLPVYGW